MKTFYCRYPRFLRCYWSSELVRDCLNHMHINWLSIIITLTFSPSTCSIYTFSNGILFRLETKRLSINLHYFIILLENTNIYLCINEIHKQVQFYIISLGLAWWLNKTNLVQRCESNCRRCLSMLYLFHLNDWTFIPCHNLYINKSVNRK